MASSPRQLASGLHEIRPRRGALSGRSLPGLGVARKMPLVRVAGVVAGPIASKPNRSPET
jgi:hypothetical protein